MGLDSLLKQVRGAMRTGTQPLEPPASASGADIEGALSRLREGNARPGLGQRGVFDQVGDWATGANIGADKDYNSLINMKGLRADQGLMLAAAYTVTGDENAIADIAMKSLSGATKREDEHGNIIVNHDGVDYAVNPPGIGQTDLQNTIGQIMTFVGPVKWASAIKTMGKRMTGQFVAGAGTSLVNDLTAWGLGSEQGVDPLKALAAGAIGPVAEVVAPLAPSMTGTARVLMQRPQFYNPQTKQWTDQGVQALEAAGISVNSMTPEVQARFLSELERGAAPVVASGQALSAEYQMPMTRAELTQSGRDARRLAEMEEGLRGPESESAVRAFHQQRYGVEGQGPGHIEQGANRVQSALSGGRPLIPTPAEGGARAGNRLQELERTAQRDVDDAYQTLRASQDEVIPRERMRLDREWARALPGRVKLALRDAGIRLDSDLHPNAVKAIRRTVARFSRMEKGTRNTPLSPFDIQTLENHRQVLRGLARAAEGSDVAAAWTVFRAYNKWWDDAVDQMLFTGDDAALALLRKARVKRAEYGRVWEADDQAGKLVQKMVAEQRTGEEMAGMVFGTSALGGKVVSAKVLERLKVIFGEDSAEWAAMREVGFLRLSRDKGGKVLASRYGSNLSNALFSSPTLMTALYTPEQIILMKGYAKALDRIGFKAGSRRARFSLEKLLRSSLGRMGQRAQLGGDPAQAAGLHTVARLPAPQIGGARTLLRGLPSQRRTSPPLVATSEQQAREQAPSSAQQINAAADWLMRQIGM